MKNKCFIIIISLFISLVSIIPIHAQNKVVKVACGMNDALYLDDLGEPAGLALPIIRQIAWNANWTIEYVKGSYSENLERLYNNEIDVMFPIGENEDPDNKLLYSNISGGIQQIGLFAKKDADIYYEDFEAFNNKNISLSLGGNSDILDKYAKDNNFNYNKVLDYNTVQDKIDALNNNKVDMVAFSTLNSIPNGKLVAILDQIPVYFCTSKENIEIYNELNNAYQQAMINTPDVVSQCYKDMLTGNATVSFTRNEHEKIINSDTIVFGVYSNILPLAGVNSKGKQIGIYVDTIKEIAKQSGLNIQIKSIKNDDKLYDYMLAGDVDFVISLADLRFHDKNADKLLITNGIGDYTTIAISQPDYQFKKNSTITFALTKTRSYLKEYIKQNYPNSSIKYYKNRKECLKSIEDGTTDVTFMNTWEFNYESMNIRFQDLKVWDNISLKSNFTLGATTSSDKELLSILEKTISQIPESTISQIITNNLNMAYDSYTLSDQIYIKKNQLIAGSIIIIIVIASIGIYLHTKKKYINDLVVANSAKNDFLSRMSHELRTPLNAINGYATLQKNAIGNSNVNDKTQKEYMDSIQNASQYLLGIIKDILNLQQMETGKMKIELSEINPNEYMNTVVNMIKPMADEKNINFTYNMISGENYNYLLDKIRLQEILFNVLYNAVKFTKPGGTVIMNSKLLDKDDKYATLFFEISDTGIGMSNEFIENKLYHRFSQENENITSPYTGVGNSLAVTKQLVELMNGTINCVSELNVGTTFTITFKVEYCKKRKRRKKNILNYDLKGLSILMCEDNKMNQDMERRLLEKMNCKVDVADDGLIGYFKFKDSKVGYYDIILMDIRMPNMDGLQATSAIRRLYRNDARTIPILAISANAFDSDIQESLESGMNEHLAKPINAKLLYEKITQYCINGEQS